LLATGEAETSGTDEDGLSGTDDIKSRVSSKPIPSDD
jgi:hypothetical protein